MNEFELEQSLKRLGQIKRHRTPESFSRGIDQALAATAKRNGISAAHRTTQRKKWGWAHTATAAAAVFACVLFAGFTSPTMAAILTNIPGLHFIFSATYTDVSEQPENPHLQRGSLFHFGENGPFNITENIDPIVRHFPNYSEAEQYIGMDIPQIPEQSGNIRVTDYKGKGYEIYAFDKSGILLYVAPNAVNAPIFEGQSVNPVVKSSADLNGLYADVLSYQFSKNNPEDRTSYVAWQRNGFTLILAGTEPAEQLITIARSIDLQAMQLNVSES